MLIEWELNDPNAQPDGILEENESSEKNCIFNAVYNYFISLFSNPTVDVEPRVMSVLVGDQ